MEEIKEDIKILKEFSYDLMQDYINSRDEIPEYDRKLNISIENVLSRLEQLEIENKSLKKQVKLMIDNFEKALDEILKENYIPNINKAIETLGEYKHYSTPNEKQNALNEEIVDKTFNILKELKRRTE